MIIKEVWQSQPGTYFCISTKTRSEAWHDHFFARDELRQLDDFIREHRNSDIYWCPHGFSAPRRIKGNAVMPTLLWADLDPVDPRALRQRPTIAIQSSTGRYVGIWEQFDASAASAIGHERGPLLWQNSAHDGCGERSETAGTTPYCAWDSMFRHGYRAQHAKAPHSRGAFTNDQRRTADRCTVAVSRSILR
jgi:hypothetical protein